MVVKALQAGFMARFIPLKCVTAEVCVRRKGLLPYLTVQVLSTGLNYSAQNYGSCLNTLSATAMDRQKP
jgi:hypothetical protein